MSTLVEIEEAVRRLPTDALAEFRAWFDRFDADRWDEQMDADIEAGRLDTLADEALKALRQGQTQDL